MYRNRITRPLFLLLLSALLFASPAFAFGDEAAVCQHEWSDWTIVTQATCGADGEMSHTCLKCSAVEAENIPATGDHVWSGWETSKQATVFTAGIKTRDCSVCGFEETGSIPKVKAFARFKKSSYTVTAGKKLSLSSKVKKGRGDSVKKWTSSNTKVATVTSSGKVTAKKKGTAKITAVLKSGKKASVKINVKAKKKKKSSGGGTVYWVDNGSVYHYNKYCRTLARSHNIHSGTIAQSGKPRACKVCG